MSYLQLREDNIRRNETFLRSIGLLTSPPAVAANARTTAGTKRPRGFSAGAGTRAQHRGPDDYMPTRRSTRVPGLSSSSSSASRRDSSHDPDSPSQPAPSRRYSYAPLPSALSFAVDPDSRRRQRVSATALSAAVVAPAAPAPLPLPPAPSPSPNSTRSAKRKAAKTTSTTTSTSTNNTSSNSSSSAALPALDSPDPQLVAHTLLRIRTMSNAALSNRVKVHISLLSLSSICHHVPMRAFRKSKLPPPPPPHAALLHHEATY